MKCMKCGLDDTNETAEQKAARLKVCRRCRGFEEGRSEEPRTEAELAGLGQRKQPSHALVQYWLHARGMEKFVDLRETETRFGKGSAARRYHLSPEQATMLLAVESILDMPQEQLDTFVEPARAMISAWLEQMQLTVTDLLAIREFHDAREIRKLTELSQLAVHDLAFVLAWVIPGKVLVRKGG